jgi:hypothetical protein
MTPLPDDGSRDGSRGDSRPVWQGRIGTRSALIGAVATTAAAAFHYAGYLDSGFNIADDGHYAQVAYELWLGTDPHAMRFGYGLAWFKLGEVLFAQLGPSYHLVQALFFTLLAATAGLVFLTVARVTGRAVPAAAAALVAAAVPAFPPTAFYAFCTLLNLALQVELAHRWRRLDPWDAVPGALALALTFQIRPDFGYAFAVPYTLLLMLGGLAAGGAGQRAGGRNRWRRAAGLAGGALAGFAAGHLPLLADGLAKGYLDLVVEDYLRYPSLLLRYVLAGLRQAGTDGTAAGTLLARPPLVALWRGNWTDAAQAVIVYAPAAGLAGFALFHITAALRRRSAAAFDRLVLAGVLLAAPLASFPHYFLFRPDLAHVANFMPGYLVLAAVFAGELAGSLLGLPAALALAAGVAVYGWVGLTTPGTGSIALAQGRDQPFLAENGVAVRVSAAELPWLQAVRTLIAEHSAPGDRIVCVPFCPGVAFMTARRMMLREYYVDDSFLVTDPGWIERTIAQTRREHTPVVVVVDWAINGTDISRFQVWARPYVAFLEEAGYRRVDLPGSSVYLAPP